MRSPHLIHGNAIAAVALMAAAAYREAPPRLAPVRPLTKQFASMPLLDPEQAPVGAHRDGRVEVLGSPVG